MKNRIISYEKLNTSISNLSLSAINNLNSHGISRLISFIILLLALFTISCDLIGLSGPPRSATTNHKMYVYSNTAQKFYLVDYRTFKMVKEIPLEMPEGVSEEVLRLVFMTLSTGGDHLFFSATGTGPDYPQGFAIYDIEKEAFTGLFYTEFMRTAAARFIAAQDESAPGLIYAHLRDYGLYAIDLFEQHVVETISEEHDFRLLRLFKQWPDKKWIVIHHRFSGTGGFHELQFYDYNSGLREPEFVLNEAGKDSIAIYDFEFSRDADRLFLTYQLSDGRSRNIESYFGSYDIQTGELYESDLRFPWSLSGYFLAYSPKRDEIYVVGNTGQFYVIAPDTYLIKSIIKIPISANTSEQSRILICPEEDMAFVSYGFENTIFIIDLNRREVIHTFENLEQPYIMIIP